MVINDDLRYITVNERKELFLQYDNEDLTGQRILIFFSEKAKEILKISTQWHVDGTFRHTPKMFNQTTSIHCVQY